MTKPKHNPGPWTVEVHQDTTTIESKHFTIAKDVSNNDAALIAAAPDMYEALLAVNQFLTETSLGLRKEIKLGSIIDKALNKAEGK